MTAPSADALATLDRQASALLDRLEALRRQPVTPQTLPEWLSAWRRIKCDVQTLWGTQIWATNVDTRDAEA
ncbi:hypothetical protein K7W42_05200 [Deinococcus sp. HMF7604]|uniref:hypothetical protein n=1 Tax=Deinococcus betulae TaxID=2873312 RepID=UPI001CCDCD8A|nr:hypothetical protein [Deinococcus betulae]MBZ9750257.1 hypothetical protein [Deinococcus betulae]